MIYLFSKSGLRFLESMCFTRTLFAFDFDGTLSKIVKNPEDAKMGKLTERLLKEICKLSTVAIISGRSLADLKSKCIFSSAHLIGNHGLEGLHEHQVNLDAFNVTSKKWQEHLKQSFKQKKYFIEGVEIEDKDYSIAIHYRKSRSKKKTRSLILNSLANLSPAPRIIMGKSVVNIVPASAPHKGIALLELMLQANTKSSFYIGDDDTDEDVFSLADPGIFTVRVGEKKKSQAKFYIKNQSEINILLKKLLIYLKQNQRTP